jgi:hypothetical protein
MMMPPVGKPPELTTFSGELGSVLLVNDEGVVTVKDMTHPETSLSVQPVSKPSSVLTKM